MKKSRRKKNRINKSKYLSVLHNFPSRLCLSDFGCSFNRNENNNKHRKSIESKNRLIYYFILNHKIKERQMRENLKKKPKKNMKTK